MTNTSSTSNALMAITARPPITMVRGQGSWLWDENGKRYLDFIQGWAVNSLGHCPLQISNALCTQSKTLITPSPALHNAPQLGLASKLANSSGLQQVHFSNSGSEANEVAIKLARKWGQLNKHGAYEIITTFNAFHGRTIAAMCASGKPGWDELFPPILPGFSKVPFADTDAMRSAITSNTVALMIEPIQGEAGVIVPDDNYLYSLRQLADEHNLLLILDEVQTGVGRTGTFYAFEHCGITPDILTLGKGLGGGVPLSATLAAERACCFEYGNQGGTYNGNPLMTAAGLAVVETVSSAGFLASVTDCGRHLKDKLLTIATKHGLLNVRGRGLLQGFDLPAPCATDVQTLAFELGLIINAPRPASIRLMPALNASKAEIDDAIMLLDTVIEQTLRDNTH
ncbi:acetylornithine transaminase [Chromatiales bacterium (ex Bugula neritina AB1)]|nr:acetylornithine transaminase [Chromatiales bacterium (ex Bugula neritina AB1)]